MEDTLQKVFSILLATMIFFLLPLYMAFEKKDDISYSLALKITSNFVDEVCNKGYMTIDMYNDFVSDLNVTGNAYDISLEHVAKVYNPVIYAYNNGKQYSFDYNLYKRLYNPSNQDITINGVTYTNPTLSYKISELRYSTDQILRVMDQDSIKNATSILNRVSYTQKNGVYDYSIGQSALDSYITLNKNNISSISGLYRTSNGKTVYPMNKGDKFTIVIKNTNVTIASMLFNTLTFGAKTGADTKVYINYGGTIANEQYRETVIDTSKVEEATDLNVDENKKLDLNKDCFVSILDREALSKALTNSTKDTIFDINEDGNVNTQDSVEFEKIMGRLFDLNGDGILNGNDTKEVQRYLAGYTVSIGGITYTQDVIKRMDTDNNGKIDSIDSYNWVRNYPITAGEDTKIEKVYLYKDGFSYALSGGFKSAGYFSTLGGNYHAASVTFNGYISITNYANGYRTYVASSNKVDLTNYNKLCVDLEGNTGASATSTWISVSSLGYYNNVEVNDTTKQTLYGGTRIYSLNGRTTMELDVSEVDTSAYIVVSFAHTNSLKIYSIWLE